MAVNVRQQTKRMYGHQQHNDTIQTSHPAKITNNKINNLRLSDQTFVIFWETNTKQLSLDNLNNELHSRFNSSINGLQITNLSFLYLTANNAVQIHIRSDVICPNGKACKLPQNDCNRLHYMSMFRICWSFPINNCTYPNCHKFHMPRQKLTDQILGLLLYIFQNRRHTQDCHHNSLTTYYISEKQFIDTYYQFYEHNPIPNMDNINHCWRQIIDSFNKYYFDYAQQKIHLNQTQSKSYVQLWHTESTSDRHSWRIIVNYDCQFFAQHTCFRTTEYNVRKCSFGHKQFKFCPYFHLDSRLVRVRDHCHVCQHGESCTRFHMYVKDLPRSISLIANCFLRYETEIKNELSDITNANNDYLMELNESQMLKHSQLCDINDTITCDNIFPDYMYAIDCDIYFDHIMDNGFHVCLNQNANETITVKWNLTHMREKLDSIQIISEIKNIFTNLNERPIDIAMKGLKKYVILSFNVSKYNIFAAMFKRIFSTIQQKWCYNRKVTIAIKPIIDTYDFREDSIQIIVEIQNVNIFASIDNMRQWFETLLYLNSHRYYPINNDMAINIVKLLRFESGSVHFMKTEFNFKNVSHKNECFATVYFKKCQLQMNELKSLPNLSVNGAKITCEFCAYQSINLIPRFVSYKPPIVWQILCAQNKLDLHYKHTEISRNIIKQSNTVNKVKKRRRLPPPKLKKRRGSPPPMKQTNIETKIYIIRNNKASESSESKCKEMRQKPKRRGTPPPLCNGVSDKPNHRPAPPILPPKNEASNGCTEDSKCGYDNNTYQCCDSFDWIRNDDYFANVLEERHERIGNLNGKEQKCEENCDELDLVIKKLCKYCLIEPFNELHILQCICMPEFVRQEYIEKHPNIAKKYNLDKSEDESELKSDNSDDETDF